jgi:PAS domain S-box-containing protein
VARASQAMELFTQLVDAEDRVVERGARAGVEATRAAHALQQQVNRLLDEFVAAEQEHRAARATAFGRATVRALTLVLGLSLCLGALLALASRRQLARVADEYDRARGMVVSQAELLAGEERFRMLVAGVREYALFLLDPTGTVRSWNAGAERITGYTEVEIVGRDFHCFYPEAEREGGAPERLLETAAREGVAFERGERLRRDGARFQAEVTLSALRDDDGLLRGFAHIARDATAERDAETAIERLTRELGRRESELDDVRRERAALSDAETGKVRREPIEVVAIAAKVVDEPEQP